MAGDVDVCDRTWRGKPLNDRAHLVTSTVDGTPVANASKGFLAFGPGGITDVQQLQSDVSALIGGIGTTGCGIEAQLESWYRFLVQPDPPAQVLVELNGKARYEGIDHELLAQRRAFLRPDSLLSIVVLTDEDDSAVDPRSVRGQGWAYSAQKFPGSTTLRNGGGGTTAPLPTSACASNPLSPDCSSCGFASACARSVVAPDSSCSAILSDPNCSGQPFYGADEDDLNVRSFHMKQRFGVERR